MRLFVIFVVNCLFKIFYKHKVYGKEHLNVDRGTIIAANHVSYLDPPIIGVSCPSEVHFLARESLFKVPGFAWLIRNLNTHPISKGSGNLGTLKMACELLEKGKKIVIFPEGSRSPTGKFQNPQTGIGLLVLRTGAIVVPAYIHGAYEIWKIQQKFPKLKGQTACVFGSPLYFEQVEGKDKKEMQAQIAQAVMAAIVNLQKWYLEGAQGTPP